MKIKATNAPAFCRHVQAIAKLAKADSPYAFDVWEKLVRLEAKAHRITSMLMDRDSDSLEKSLDEIEKQVKQLLPKAKSVFINRDARGYALKIKEAEAINIKGLYTDWGGYGIIAPEF